VGRANNRARKPEDSTESFLEQSAKSLSENVKKAAPFASASYTLIGAIILLGGVGYALDQWLDSSPWFLLVGLLLGITVGFYELAKLVWRR